MLSKHICTEERGKYDSYKCVKISVVSGVVLPCVWLILMIKTFFDLKVVFFFQFPQKFFKTPEKLSLADVAHFDEKNIFLT